MATPVEYRFKINAYTPLTMPLDRLATYLRLLARVMGHATSVHLIAVEGGSTTPVLKVDWEDDAKVRQRVHDTNRGVGPAEAMSAKAELEDHLAQDNADGAALDRSGTKVLRFVPRGRQLQEGQAFGPFDQTGTLDGFVTRIGSEASDADPVSVLLRSLEGTLQVCRAPEDVARKLIPYWRGTPVRVNGVAKWLRHPDGIWEMRQFTIADFLPLETDSLSEVVRRMRSIPAAWKSSEDPIGDMMGLRGDSSDHD